MGMRTEPGVAGRDEADGAAAAGAPPRRGFGAGAAVALALGLAAVIIVSDQVTKAAITARYGPCGNPFFHPVFGSYAGFSYVCNTGTAFSRFAGNSLVWIPVGLAAAAVCWLWLRSLAAPHLAQQLAFGLILGGATGNLIDRARLGYVVDFVDLRLTDTLRWYVFNVADASVVIGVTLLALAYWRSAGRE
ncbi:MAG TPA: signal peptidase II [Thermomicrobiales bacterium]|nr:signal peptidase II [Thermomicrobiales bacterium]